MKLKTIEQIKNLTGKKVLVRVDFNVPLKKGKVLDTTRIKAVLPTIEFLIGKRAKVILASHLGRPKGKKKKALSLKPVAIAAKRLFKKNVQFVGDCIGPKPKKVIAKMRNGQIILLENLRFYPGEEKNDLEFAKELASLVDVYVNDAFANCHREHASIAAVTKYLPSYAGFLLVDEIDNLDKILKPKKPLIALIGGVKISTKIKVIENLSKKAKYILLGGAIANNFFKAKGYQIGSSIYDPREVKLAKKLIRNKKIVLPVDVVVGDFKGKKTRISLVGKSKALCRKPYAILDIGPETVKYYAGLIRKAKTIVWNGPMGYYEIKQFSHGSVALGQLIAARSKGKVFGVVGGGETLACLEMTKMREFIDHVSTGGGAMLQYLEGRTLPGIKLLSLRR